MRCSSEVLRETAPTIAAIGRRKAVHLVHSYRHLRALFEPFLYFRVSIGKTKTAGPIVITGRQIDPLIGVVHAHDRPAVVDAVGLLVHKYPKLGGTWIDDIGHFLVAPPIRIPMRVKWTVLSRVSIPFNKSVHPHAADPGHHLSAHSAIIDVGGAEW